MADSEDDKSDSAYAAPGGLFESPHKQAAGSVKRDARTARLRETDFVVVFDTLAEFEKAFFDGHRPSFDIDDCLLAKDEYDLAVKTIRAAVRRGKSKKVLEKAAYGPVCDLLNKICDKYALERHVPDEDQIQFLIHSANPPRHHPDRYVDARAHQHPDLVALKKTLAALCLVDIQAWDDQQKASIKKPAAAWHHLLSVVEGKGEVDPDGLYQAATYTGSLLQARPDLPCHFSLSFDINYIQLLLCDSSGVYATPELEWASDEAHRLLVTYAHFLHIPRLGDSSIKLQPPSTEHDKAAVKNWKLKSYATAPVWIVYDDAGNRYIVDRIISVGEPWTRKSWVVLSSRYGPADEPPTERPPVVIKDSWLQPQRLESSSEGDLLDRIHFEGMHVLGVMRKVRAFTVRDEGGKTICNINVDVLRNGQRIPIRHRYRLILDASVTTSIFECPDVLSFFIAMFDVLAISRYIHKTRRILHRDLSLWNLVFFGTGDAGLKLCNDYCAGVNLSVDQPHFARFYLAYELENPRMYNWPSILVLDFDNAKLELQQGYTGTLRTVTPAFIAMPVARRVSTRGSVPAEAIPELTGTALESYTATHGTAHYEEQSALHEGSNIPSRVPEEVPIVHAPRHDAESVWWMLVVFMLSALPKEKDPTKAKNPPVDKNKQGLKAALREIDSHEVTPLSDKRSSIMSYTLQNWRDALHEDAAEFAPFFERMRLLFQPDYALAQPGLDPYNLHEAMQRLLLQEIWRMKELGDPCPLNPKQRDYHIDPATGYSATRPGTFGKRAVDADSHADMERSKKRARQEEKEAKSKQREEEKAAKAKQREEKVGSRRSSRLADKSG
ncbi:hypothetical protein EXIGLDRAFT_846136 [Exidia glandulosa HHB12029]|uniref:Fungal-type protein kinase domain-containing protein n=1 Tax=Exidia glandulosa HHB12029 TaxID=1314781 RepID=A0A165B531_EXIGL|nr:hypothetical protein EXIGLDRAFT_846136 [Exidia glandulosa HHB12029]